MKNVLFMLATFILITLVSYASQHDALIGANNYLFNGLFGWLLWLSFFYVMQDQQ